MVSTSAYRLYIRGNDGFTIGNICSAISLSRIWFYMKIATCFRMSSHFLSDLGPFTEVIHAYKLHKRKFKDMPVVHTCNLKRPRITPS